MFDLSRYALETLREDGEFVLYRGFREGNPSLLIVAPALEHIAAASLARLEHEFSLRAKLDSEYAARPLALVRHQGRRMLVLEDPVAARIFSSSLRSISTQVSSNCSNRSVVDLARRLIAVLVHVSPYDDSLCFARLLIL
jgi:hypothetical protein